MAIRLVLCFALFALPALVSARYVGNPLLVRGRVYCDTCRCGYETSATKYLAGARVKMECRNRDTNQVTYSIIGTTDSTGTYNILVTDDRGDDVCDAVLVHSSDPECAIPNQGRDRARVILTRHNGMVSDTRFVNAMGFLKNEALATCTQILKQYQESEE